MTTTEKAIRKIQEDGVGNIVELAVNNYQEGSNSIVFYDPDTDDFTCVSWTKGMCLSNDSDLVEVYEIDGNFIGNNSWDVNDILDDDEYKEYKKKVAENEGLTDETDIEYAADFLDAEKLQETIGVDFKERLVEYLLDAKNLKELIIEDLRGSEY